MTHYNFESGKDSQAVRTFLRDWYTEDGSLDESEARESLEIDLKLCRVMDVGYEDYMTDALTDAGMELPSGVHWAGLEEAAQDLHKTFGR